MQTISFNHPESHAPSKHMHAIFGWFSRLPDIDWYQVVIVAVTTFAIAMDLMFPPTRIALGNGLTVYAGHFFTPLSMPAATQVDFGWLAVELLAILALGVIGWNLGRTRPAESDGGPDAA
jgi:hypothetical protein